MLSPYSGTEFAMYRPAAYTPLASESARSVQNVSAVLMTCRLDVHDLLGRVRAVLGTRRTRHVHFVLSHPHHGMEPLAEMIRLGLSDFSRTIDSTTRHLSLFVSRYPLLRPHVIHDIMHAAQQWTFQDSQIVLNSAHAGHACTCSPRFPLLPSPPGSPPTPVFASFLTPPLKVDPRTTSSQPSGQRCASRNAAGT